MLIDSQFEIPRTENLDYAADYNLKLKSSIEMPMDNSADPQMRTISSEIDFIVQVINPCESSQMETFEIDDMQTSVKGPSRSQILSFPSDSVSLELGDKKG